MASKFSQRIPLLFLKQSDSSFTTIRYNVCLPYVENLLSRNTIGKMLQIHTLKNIIYSWIRVEFSMKKENSKNNNLYKNNIDEVKIILNIIGSPFNESKNIELVNYAELYGIAQKNKIGLLLLESLFTGQIINGLQSELDKQRLSHNHLHTID